ncbi:MAG TPA: hypothetical protein VLH56_05225 [Dissulfurispiraceae bacterium]|nr:hypothetical protein [Dissulfurispiraceae bacterium]
MTETNENTESGLLVIGDEVTCKRCQQVIGRIIIVDGIELFETGGLIVRELQTAWCKNCGAKVYYSVSNRHLEKIIQKVLAAR